VNPDTIGYVWTGEYDLNTLRVDGEIFLSGTKKLRIRKYPDTCGQGLSIGPSEYNADRMHGFARDSISTSRRVLLLILLTLVLPANAPPLNKLS